MASMLGAYAGSRIELVLTNEVGAPIVLGVTLDTLSARLRWSRDAAGISARTLSALTGLHRSHVSLIEGGEKASVDAGTLAKLADVLGVSMDWLYSGRGRRPSKAEIATAVARARRRGSNESGEHPAITHETATRRTGT